MKISLGNGTAVKIGNQTVLFDPKVSDFVTFVSHAHSDHTPFGFVTKPYCTEETYDLIKLRDPYFEANAVKENEKIKFDDFSVRLISSGHVLGAAQIFIEADGFSLLYSGDFKLSNSLTCKPIKIQEADILITESTYGRPDFIFEPIENVRKNIIQWVKKQLADKYSVDLGGYHIGKAQEAIKLLNDNGIVPKISETIRQYSNVYKKFGVNLDFVEPHEDSKIFVKPMHLLNKRRGKNVKICALTGWTTINRYEFGFPLSDHCDFKQIMDFVAQVNPNKVYCIHGFVKELSKEIKERLKINAMPLKLSEQKSITDF